MSNLPPQLHIEPLTKPINCTIDDLPGSKSITNRALLLAALAGGTSTLTNVLFSDDTRVMMTALQSLGFKLNIDEPNHTVTVEGCNGKIPNKKANLHLGNAGTAMRFLTAACCLGEPGSEYTLLGIDRMHERPIGELVEPLRKLGAKIEYEGEEGFPPLRVHGGIKGGEVTMQPSLSSQFVSALIIAGPCMPKGLTIRPESPITSKPYVEMTLMLITEFGVAFERGTLAQIQIKEGTRYTGKGFAIEPDASNASYFLAAAALTPGSRLIIRGLDSRSIQGDARFITQVLSKMGVTPNNTPGSIAVTGPDHLHGIDIDINDMPDMAQTLAVVALFAKGSTTIRNIRNLRVKETDRIAALQNELTKLDATVVVHANDDITITPPADGKINSGVAIDTYDDHRMAMAFAIAGLVPGGPGITINDPSCVTKTFPDFFDYLDKLR